MELDKDLIDKLLAVYKGPEDLIGEQGSFNTCFHPAHAQFSLAMKQSTCPSGEASYRARAGVECPAQLSINSSLFFLDRISFTEHPQ